MKLPKPITFNKIQCDPMKLSITHTTQYHYAKPTGRIDLLLRLWPTAFDGQVPGEWQVLVNDAVVTGKNLTAFGDLQAHLHLAIPAQSLEIVATGNVESAGRAGVVANLPRDAVPAVFLRPSHLTQTSADIAAMAHALAGPSRLDLLHNLMGVIREKIAYRTGTTTAKTSAAEAFAQGAGVCQDHAHVFIAAARVLNIPARYVVGYYLAGSDESVVSETHGWAEAWVDGLGWVGFDTTNGVCPGEHHVRLCTGFDAYDAAPVKGFAYGGGDIGVNATVRIAQAPDIGNEDLQMLQQQQQ